MPSDRGRTKKKVPYQTIAYQILVIMSSDPTMGATLVCVCVAYLQANFLSHFNTEFEVRNGQVCY